MNWQHDSALIGGAWTPAPKTWPVENPATEKIIGTAALCDEAMVERAVSAARDALPAWETRAPVERADILDALAPPFGGWKQSGIGSELGAVGLEEYTELTSVQR